ncbi:C2H2 type zinc-finger-domain-containing protein [Xylariaceae sp. FL0016]|nr:C2H2 type zinc-finger-domain-containing protein [Xylariaceae sp. FL0016]
MLGATTTTTTTATSSTQPMHLPFASGTNTLSTFPSESVDSPNVTMHPITPTKCLFCPITSPSFTDNVTHMRISHGLLIPHQQHLLVDLETLFEYLHLVISGYRECVFCGTSRATVQGVQQHMTAKGHCRFDITKSDSEFAEFYDFSRPEESSDSEAESSAHDNMALWNGQNAAARLHRGPIRADEDTLRLPSGKIISKHSSSQFGGSSPNPRRRRPRRPTSQLEHSLLEPRNDDKGPSNTEPMPVTNDTRVLSKREKRENATVTHQLASMRTNDRNALVHLSSAQQRSMLATQFRHAEKVQKEERRRTTRIDRKGNKNLYAYWHTETPVYLCG